MSGWSMFVRQATALFFILAVALALVLLTVKYEVQSLKDELGQLNREIVREREAIQVLHAEFAFLTQPDRLRRLSTQHLGLTPVEPRQLSTFAALDAALDRAAPADGKPQPKRGVGKSDGAVHFAARGRGGQR
jgi:cell division protein FtsL